MYVYLNKYNQFFIHIYVMRFRRALNGKSPTVSTTMRLAGFPFSGFQFFSKVQCCVRSPQVSLECVTCALLFLFLPSALNILDDAYYQYDGHTYGHYRQICHLNHKDVNIFYFTSGYDFPVRAVLFARIVFPSNCIYPTFNGLCLGVISNDNPFPRTQSLFRSSFNH